MRRPRYETCVFKVIFGFLTGFFFMVQPLAAETLKLHRDTQAQRMAGILYALQVASPGSRQQPIYVFSLLNTDVGLNVESGMVRVRVTQLFRNDNNVSLRGRYIFPLPDEGVVNDHIIKVANQAIKSEFSTGDTLQKSGKTHFITTSEFHCLPWRTVEIQVTYHQPINSNNGVYSIFFPLTTGNSFQTKKDRKTPFLLQSNLAPQHRFVFSADISGILLSHIKSTTHDVLIEEVDRINRKYRVFLADDYNLPDSDFIMDIFLAENTTVPDSDQSSGRGKFAHNGQGR